MLDIPVARILPSLLRSYRIQCKNPVMRQVIICHEELSREDIYQLQDGAAYVPLFSDQCVLVFQDAAGVRYMNVPYEKTRVMNRPDLETRCFEVYPAHPMLLLAKVREILGSGIGGEADIAVLEQALEQDSLRSGAVTTPTP